MLPSFSSCKLFDASGEIPPELFRDPRQVSFGQLLARAWCFRRALPGDIKGLERAARIILDNVNQGRRRALWLFLNNDLLESARRDLNDFARGDTAGESLILVFFFGYES